MTAKNSEPNEPIDQQLTQLISYLDGELSVDEMTQMEVDLVNDPDMRSHADVLSRTWAMLDDMDEELPESQTFTRDTLATIQTMEAAEPSSTSTRQQWDTLLTTVARYQLVPALILGIAVGSIAVFLGRILEQRQTSDPIRQTESILLENLDVLRYRELYDMAPSATQLKQLQQATQSKTEQAQ